VISKRLLQPIVYLAVLLWLAATLSGAHWHVCQDEQSALSSAISSAQIHTLSTHHTHEAEGHHHDADMDTVATGLTHLVKIDIPLLPLIGLLLLVLVIYRVPQYSDYRLLPRLPLLRIRPPLRAPPLFSA